MQTLTLLKRLQSKQESIPYPKTIERPDPTMDEGKKVTSQTPVNGYTSEAYKILRDPNTSILIDNIILTN